MKLVLKVLKFIFLTILSVILILILYYFVSSKIFLESKNSENINYLKNNKANITNTIDEKLFDSDFYKSNVFLLGEIHGYADNQKLDKELLFFLNKKLGVTHYIAEIDSLTAKKLNLFLNNKFKNKELLKEVVLDIKIRIPQQASKELFDKWMDIYDYNSKLEDSLKINIIGIDKNLDDNSSISRDVAMFENFKNCIKNNKLKDKKFYGLFGFFHTLQNPTDNGKDTFASRLTKSGFRVTSFASYTLESEMYLPNNGQFPTPKDEKVSWNADGPIQIIKGINDLKTASEPNSITLFKLNSENSSIIR
jgi:hypothetical protein